MQESEDPAPGLARGVTATVGASPTPPLLSITAVPQATPSSFALTVWGPPAFDPSQPDGDPFFSQELLAFEEANEEITVEYRPRALSGPAGLLNYLRSASAVAPSVVPDLVIIPTTLFTDAAQTGLLLPLDPDLLDTLGQDMYPFALRDTRIGESWLAIPLVVQVEHGVTRAGESNSVPETLDRLLRPNAPVWLFAAQTQADGEMTNALLLQLVALNQQMPVPGRLPAQEDLVALMATLQAAQEAGSVPRQSLLISDEASLYERLAAGQADFIQSNSSMYLSQRRAGAEIEFSVLPTMSGTMPTVVTGLLVALTTDDPARQEAAGRLVEWLLSPERLAGWNRSSTWLPARRSALQESIEDDSYRAFLEELLQRGWLRPGGAAWSAMAQAFQEQFRAVMTEEASPVEAVDYILETFPAPP